MPNSLLWLIPALPLAGAALNGLSSLGGRRAPKALVTAIGVGAPLASLAVALTVLGQFLSSTQPALEQTLYSWTAGALTIPIAFRIDPLSAVMLFVVTFVGFWIHVYSVGYMGHEAGYQRYFTYLNLFMGAMLLLILGNNFLLAFVGWEGVGLCSYLLIGFYYDQEVPPAAGKKAFIVNRVGDFAFLVGMFYLASKLGTLTYSEIFPKLADNPEILGGAVGWGLSGAAFVGLCLFVGAMGKSAQIPLYVWLPDAMAGPTPVSALIHAATMVTAGVYMCTRANAIYQLAPGISFFIAIIGAATAIFAATIGVAQNDIKKVLAYSTVSQLGYMFLAVGLGAYTAAVFHLMTHAFFKALLFLGSGSVIHAMNGEQDMRKMGGLKAYLPQTYRTFLIGGLAIAGIPPLAGFFSKDEILHAAAADGHWILYLVGLATAGLTAFYMFRAIHMTFDGKLRSDPAAAGHGHGHGHGHNGGDHEDAGHGHDSHGHGHGGAPHESPAVMTIPLWILAAGAVVAGFVNVPKLLGFLPFPTESLHHFLEPVYARIEGAEAAEHAVAGGVEWILLLLAVVVAISGILLARRLYGGDQGVAADDAFAARAAGLRRLLENKYYVDELYDRLIVKPLAALARFLWKGVDAILIDGAINTGAFLTELSGDLVRFSTTGNVRSYALYFFLGVIALFWWILR